MGTVISLSEDAIRELLAGYEGVSLNQDQINALVQEMYIAQQTINARMEFLEGTTVPQLVQDVASGDIRIDELTETVIPELEAAQTANATQLNDLLTVVLPALQQDLENTATNVNDSPKTYRPDEYPEPPLNPDNDLRDLVVGDRWFDGAGVEHTWNGVEWTTLQVDADIEDFSLTAQKFKTSKHMIY